MAKKWQQKAGKRPTQKAPAKSRREMMYDHPRSRKARGE